MDSAGRAQNRYPSPLFLLGRKHARNSAYLVFFFQTELDAEAASPVAQIKTTNGSANLHQLSFEPSQSPQAAELAEQAQQQVQTAHWQELPEDALLHWLAFLWERPCLHLTLHSQ